MNQLVAFGVTFVVFALVIAGMAIGVLMGRRQISGSCGGLANQTDAEGNTSCSLCSNPDAACKELAQRQRDSSAGVPAGTTASAESRGCEKDCEEEGCSKEEIDACKGN